MKKAILVLALLSMTACNEPHNQSEANANMETESCKPMLVAVADDGTRLWKLASGCRNNTSRRPVFFSSGGGTQTEHTEHCGKNCTRHVDDYVPNGGAK